MKSPIYDIILCENDVMYKNKSFAILCAKEKRSSTPDVTISKFLIVS